jgi:hypothetical protein
MDGDAGTAGNEVGSVSVTAQSNIATDVEAWGLGLGGVAALNGAAAISVVSPTVAASMADAAVSVSDDVTVDAASEASVEVTSVAASLAGGVAFGGALSIAYLTPAVNAYIDNSSVNAGERQRRGRHKRAPTAS